MLQYKNPDIVRPFMAGMQLAQYKQQRELQRLKLGMMQKEAENAEVMRNLKLAEFAERQKTGAVTRRKTEQEIVSSQQKTANENMGFLATALEGVTPENYAPRLEALEAQLGRKTNAPREYDPDFIANANAQIDAARQGKTPWRPAGMTEQQYFDRLHQKPVRGGVGGGAGEGKLTARQKKIKFWVDQGVPEARATAAVDKLIHYEPSELTGKVLVTNTVTGKSWVIDPESVEAKMGLGNGDVPPDASVLPQRRGETLWQVAGQGTGIGSAIKGAANVAAGVFGGAPFPKVDTARKMIKTTSIRFSQNQRKNVRSETERREVEKTFGLFSKVYNSPALFRNNLRRLNNDLRNYLAKTVQSAENKRLTPKIRAGYRDEAEQLKDMIRQLGVPRTVMGDNDPSYQSLESGAQYFYDGKLRIKK